MPIDVLLGLQWGDEGKGKIVDSMISNSGFRNGRYDVIARFQGGPNEGHTLMFGAIKHVTHTIPSGIFNERCINIVGNGVVIDPVTLKKEIDDIAALGIDVIPRLLLSKKAHLILPTHKFLDAASEKIKGIAGKIGTTLRGIGPAYMDKTGRNGIRVGDTTAPDFKSKYNFLVKKHGQLLNFYHCKYRLAEYEDEWFSGIECIRAIKHIDSEYYLMKCLKERKSILAEGAQGTLLDIDFGSYPYVTSSSTICAGACTGLGIAPRHIGEVYGIFKAYCTRVGNGPFPTELTGGVGDVLRKNGNEYGATTGRPRRCGWLDLPALKYAVMINGVSQLIMTKADVLSGLDVIRVCTHYKTGKNRVKSLPFNITENLTPVFKDLKGWRKKLSGISSADDLPPGLFAYIRFIEDELNLKITLVSTGPERSQVIALPGNKRVQV